MQVRNSNDGTQATPYLRIDLNIGNLMDLPDWSLGPKLEDPDVLHKVKAAGFSGFQGGEAASSLAAGLRPTTSGRVNKPDEIDTLVPAWKASGYELATLHVGWGMESDEEIDTLVRNVLEVSVENDFPLYIETHRATIAQDNYRTIKMIERNPGVRFNSDLSHFYTGHEMTYGDIQAKFDFLQPLFERTCFIHGRIGNSCNMQIRWNDPSMEHARSHFREMWRRIFTAWKASAGPGDFFCFTPEIIPFIRNYARHFEVNGELREENDRWLDALAMVEFAKAIWDEA